MIKPYSESCDQNRDVILSIILPIFSNLKTVLEVGSGTGQHAVYFAEKMSHLMWHTSDCQPYLDGINMWLEESRLKNVTPPFELNVSTSNWPEMKIDAVFTANSIHIMNDMDVENFMAGVSEVIKSQGSLVIYGPFNYGGSYSSESNERFDQWLKSRDVKSGIKHFEDIQQLAIDSGLQLLSDYEMPANNRILHFIKK